MTYSAGGMIAGYRIEKVLGSGGMGTVYLAANPVLPRWDALKVLGSQLSKDPAFRARFIREADLAATLDHPNIVTVYNRGETPDGQLWIAMQYVAGSDAQKEVDQGRMTAERAVRVVAEVAKALDYAHRRNLVHRDVKPANFLLTTHDERVLLADFGIARALDDSVGLTATGTVLATIAYAAPETLGSGHVDGRADLYALGCSLFRMLTGQTPFASSGGIAAMMAAHLSQPPPRVTDYAPWLPERMNAVIAKAMAKYPPDRYRSAGEFADAAVGALDVPTASVSRAWPVPSLTQPRGYFAGQHVAGPPMGGVPSWPGEPPRRRRRGRWIAAAVVALVFAAAGSVAALRLGHGGSGGSSHAYPAQTFTHEYGTTRVNAEPHAVAAVGSDDGSAVLSLGVQPVVMTIPDGRLPLPSWEQQLVTGTPKLLSSLRGNAFFSIAAARPDLIIATEGIDEATYEKLAAIAPTVTRPSGIFGTDWPWQEHLEWVGRILGRSDKAQQLLDNARTQQEKLRAEHPAFNGKTVVAVKSALVVVQGIPRKSYTATYLEGLGFRYSDEVQITSGIPKIGEILTRTDVLVVQRDANDRGTEGPQEFPDFRGPTVIVDDADVLTALHTGGYAATEYLNSTFANTLAEQVH